MSVTRAGNRILRGYVAEPVGSMPEQSTDMPEHAHAGEACGAGLAAQAYSPRPLTEGELWTAEALAKLHDDRYRPSAWWRFIGASLKRAGETRRAHPSLVRQARIWGATGAAAWLVASQAADRRGHVSHSRTAGLLWWGSVWKMLDWHLGMAEGGDGKPRERLSSADAVTLFRFWLVPLLPAVRTRELCFPALIVVGGLSDWLDGALAQTCGRTRLGRDLDTTADLAFLTAAAVSAEAAGRLPAPGAWAVLGRHLAGTLLALAVVFGRARRPAIRARPWGGALRVGGLALAVAGARRTGTIVLIAGCLIPPRSTAPRLSPA
jgi:phosphatidylglycerophosphate synthase